MLWTTKGPLDQGIFTYILSTYPLSFGWGGISSGVGGYLIIELQFRVAHSSKTFQYPLLNVHLTKIDPLLVYVLLTYPPRSCGGDDLKKVKV